MILLSLGSIFILAKFKSYETMSSSKESKRSKEHKLNNVLNFQTEMMNLMALFR